MHPTYKHIENIFCFVSLRTETFLTKLVVSELEPYKDLGGPQQTLGPQTFAYKFVIIDWYASILNIC